jgi:hypothetical protein
VPDTGPKLGRSARKPSVRDTTRTRAGSVLSKRLYYTRFACSAFCTRVRIRAHWMSVEEQRTEIPKLGRGHPDHRKAILDQSASAGDAHGVDRVPADAFRPCGSRRMTHAARYPQFFPSVAATIPSSRWLRCPPRPALGSTRRTPVPSPLVFQRFLDDLSCLAIQHGNRLLRRWQIATYTFQRGLPSTRSDMSLDMHSLLGPLRGRRPYDIRTKCAETIVEMTFNPFAIEWVFRWS